MLRKFCQYLKPISISLSPNVEKDDVRLALKLIFQPWKWKRGSAIQELEKKFAEYLGVKYAISFNSGRSSLFAILESLGLQKGDEVLLQAFTCNAVPNPVLWAGLKPVYVDCKTDDFNMDADDLEKKISSRSKAVILQHTFGLPADIERVQEICRRHNLFLIEDCAHALGAEYGKPASAKSFGEAKKVGAFGDAAFFSFSRDKVISSVYGGMAVSNDPALAEKLRQAKDKFGLSSYFWIFQQILHPIFLHYVILPLYNILDLGKIFLVFSQMAHILSKAVSFKEKRGGKPDYFPKALPNALAQMALHQFLKLDRFNEHRKEISAFYYENLKDTNFILPPNPSDRKQSFLRFTIKSPNAHEILYEAWHKQNMLLGDWYTTPIAPFDTKLDAIQYQMGMCKNAERLANETLNLPTYINCSKKDAQRVVDFLKQWK